MQKRFGVVGVTAVGMFGRGPLWLAPLTSATVTVTVGDIETKMVLVDGAPAARFGELLSNAEQLGATSTEHLSNTSPSYTIRRQAASHR